MDGKQLMAALERLSVVADGLNTEMRDMLETLSTEGLMVGVGGGEPKAAAPAAGSRRVKSSRRSQGKRPLPGYRMQDYLDKVVPRDGTQFTASSVAPKVWDAGYRGGNKGSLPTTLAVLMSKLRIEGKLIRVAPRTYCLAKKDIRLGV